jgi:sensor histidine kinase YesM
VAVLAACAASQLSSVTIVEWVGAAIFGPTPWVAPTEFATPITTAIYVFTHQLLFAGTGVLLYAQWRAAHRMQQHLREAELERLRKSRLALESRLQALQARVEPAFLFTTLSQVRDLYDRDGVLSSLVRASKMLDDLIAYLRAAMPHMRDTSSTVAQEAALARAYLDIARLRMDGRLNVDVTVAATIESARMPPMMLLPLIDDALAACDGAAGPAPSIRIDITARGDRLQASVTRTPVGPMQTQAPALTAIRERLSGLYGVGASFEVAEPKVACIEARLDIPLEFASDAPSEAAHTATGRARGAQSM